MEYFENSAVEINRYDIHNDTKRDNAHDHLHRMALLAPALESPEHSFEGRRAVPRLATTLQIPMDKNCPKNCFDTRNSGAADLTLMELKIRLFMVL